MCAADWLVNETRIDSGHTLLGIIYVLIFFCVIWFAILFVIVYNWSDKVSLDTIYCYNITMYNVHCTHR